MRAFFMVGLSADGTLGVRGWTWDGSSENVPFDLSVPVAVDDTVASLRQKALDAVTQRFALSEQDVTFLP